MKRSWEKIASDLGAMEEDEEVLNLLKAAVPLQAAQAEDEAGQTLSALYLSNYLKRLTFHPHVLRAVVNLIRKSIRGCFC